MSSSISQGRLPKKTPSILNIAQIEGDLPAKCGFDTLLGVEKVAQFAYGGGCTLGMSERKDVFIGPRSDHPCQQLTDSGPC